MKLPTFSSIHRAMECPASCVLPQTQHVSAPAVKGSVLHSFLADARRLGREKALELVPEEHRGMCEAIDFGALPVYDPDAFAAEVALAYNVDTGEARELGRDIGRRYPDLGPRWLYGTLDLQGLSPSDVLVFDFKSGWSQITPAERNWQLRAAAVTSAALHQRQSAFVGIVRLNTDPPEFDCARLQPFDLADAAMKLQEMVGFIEHFDNEYRQGHPVMTVEGPHCEWCPAFTACPPKARLATRLGSDPASVEAEIVALLTPETALRAYERLKLVKGVILQVEAALEGFARQTPIEVAPGVIYGPRPYTVESLIGPAAKPAIEAILGAGYADRAVELNATKAGIERAVRKWLEDHPGSGETIKSLKEKVLTEIRRVGAAKKSTTYPVGESKPRRAA